MLSPTVDTLRLFIHVLAACIWVGGQIVLAGVVPSLRRSHPEGVKVVARAFSRIAWGSFVVVVVTGIWNIYDVRIQDADWPYTATVFVHITLAVCAGIAVAVHAFGRSKLALALGGAFGLLFSLAALFVGLLLHTGV